MGTQETIRSVSDRFGISESTVYATSRRVISALMSFHPKIICWPKDDSEIEVTKSVFRRIEGIPHAFGAIDGCHIHISAPSVDP